MQFEISGLPTPWAAHQGYGRKSFNPRFKEKEYAQWQFKSQFNRNSPIAGPIHADICFHLPIPAGTSKARKRDMLAGRLRHIKKPDVDNLTKFILDAAKKIIFDDDSQIVTLFARKIYSECPKTIIRIEECTSSLA